MDLKELEKLPLQEKIAKLKELKEKFLTDKSNLGKVMKELEKAVDEREEFAKTTTNAGRKILKNEVRAITGSIKEAKLRIQAKEDELKLLEKALAEAEQRIMASETELEHEITQKKEKSLFEMMVDEQRKKEQEDAERKQSLEEQVKREEIPEEKKKEIESSPDYMKNKEENIYITKTNGIHNEDLKPGYEKHKPEFKKDEEPWKETYEEKKEEYK